MQPRLKKKPRPTAKDMMRMFMPSLVPGTTTVFIPRGGCFSEVDKATASDERCRKKKVFSGQNTYLGK